ncbi:FUSC family protein [Nocardia sp. NPDC052566]|uniref:FUSC family protein n=1 Tax=Nocardia sp. NPDC052566 TaxID=3364330 RepID=UPI0037CC913E
MSNSGALSFWRGSSRIGSVVLLCALVFAIIQWFRDAENWWLAGLVAVFVAVLLWFVGRRYKRAHIVALREMGALDPVRDVEFHERAFDTASAAFGAGDTRTLVAKLGLVRAYWVDGHRESALRSCEELFLECVEHLGFDHPLTRTVTARLDMCQTGVRRRVTVQPRPRTMYLMLASGRSTPSWREPEELKSALTRLLTAARLQTEAYEAMNALLGRISESGVDVAAAPELAPFWRRLADRQRQTTLLDERIRRIHDDGIRQGAAQRVLEAVREVDRLTGEILADCRALEERIGSGGSGSPVDS